MDLMDVCENGGAGESRKTNQLPNNTKTRD